MERDPPQKFDLISVDAFSSGSIPIHLLTREALQAYRRHLAPGGVIVYNVTNRFVNLAPQLKLVAEAEGMKILLMNDDPTDDKYSGTAYVLVTDNPSAARRQALRGCRRHRADQGPRDLDRRLQQPVQGRPLAQARGRGPRVALFRQVVEGAVRGARRPPRHGSASRTAVTFDAVQAGIGNAEIARAR